MRDPTILEDTPEARLKFVPKAWQVLTDAYQNGSHVRLTYTKDGQLTTDPDSTSVVEYIRCGGWEWTPVRNITMFRRCTLIPDVDRTTAIMMHNSFVQTVPSPEFPMKGKSFVRWTPLNTNTQYMALCIATE